MIEVDARGLSCPEPVIMAKKALKKSPEGRNFLIIRRKKDDYCFKTRYK